MATYEWKIFKYLLTLLGKIDDHTYASSMIQNLIKLVQYSKWSSNSYSLTIQRRTTNNKIYMDANHLRKKWKDRWTKNIYQITYLLVYVYYVGL